jgi:hypothetical protein
MENKNFEINKRNTTWIENLAIEELNAEETGIVNINGHLDPAYQLEESSIELMSDLRDDFEFYVSRFNSYKHETDSSSRIKVFKISNTINDFMLFRNSLKLIIARKTRDLISIGFLSNTGGLFAARLTFDKPALNMAHELKAHIGAFGEITWRFNGEIVNKDILVRHYLTEFVKHSAH